MPVEIETAGSASKSFGYRAPGVGAKTLLLIVLVLAAGRALSHEPEGEVRYLGNEGVWVRAEGGQAMFDSLFIDDLGYYQLVPTELRETLWASHTPFDDVRLVLVSHVHADHFDPGAVASFLHSNPGATLFAPAQVTDALFEQQEGDESLRARMHGFDLEPDDAAQVRVHDKFQISGVAIPHSGGARMAGVQNIAFRVTLANGLTVLHLGDATTDRRAFENHRDFLQQPLAAVFAPFWLLDSENGLQLLEDFFDADQVFGIHVPVEARRDVQSWRARHGHDLLLIPGEARALATPAHKH